MLFRSELQKRFSRLGVYVRRREPGYGLERCLYETNPGLPCQSPLLAKDYAADIRGLLFALDAAAEAARGDVKPLDRHITAFIASRFDHDLSNHLKALADAAEGKALIGMLGLLAVLQAHFKVPPLFGLTNWVVGLLGPAIATYHSRATRGEVEREVHNAARHGDLTELYGIIENRETRWRDTSDFAAAVTAFAAADAEIERIEGGDEALSVLSRNLGRRAAATISMATCLIVIAATLLIQSI